MLQEQESIQYESGTAGNTDAVYRLFLFDIRPFTYLTLNDTPSPTLIANRSNGGVQVKGKPLVRLVWFLVH